MGSSEKFCLRWNDFESNISGAFRELREDKDFFDVTLACDEDQLQAHKVILSACSPFFRTVLRRNKHEHPLLYLKGVKYVDLVAVLNFMYHGEVNVAQEELNSFLAVAEELKVKGLTQNNADGGKPGGRIQAQNDLPKTNRLREPPERDLAPPAMKRPRPSVVAPVSRAPAGGSSFPGDDDIQEVMPVVKSEPVMQPEPVAQPVVQPVHQQQHTVTQHTIAHAQQEQEYEHEQQGGGVVADPNMEDYGAEAYEDYGYEGADNSYDGTMVEGAAMGADGNKGILTTPESLVIEEDGPSGKLFRCTVCLKLGKRKDNLIAHAESHLLTEPLPCDHCGKLFKTRNSLTSHVSRWHRH